jgi:hypothetical protein
VGVARTLSDIISAAVGWLNVGRVSISPDSLATYCANVSAAIYMSLNPLLLCSMAHTSAPHPFRRVLA